MLQNTIKIVPSVLVPCYGTDFVFHHHNHSFIHTLHVFFFFLSFIRSHLFLFVFYFHFSRRWAKKDLAVIYVKVCSASVILLLIPSSVVFISVIVLVISV